MSSDDGSMTVAMTGVIAIIAALSVAVAALGTLYAARAQATNAADAAALAAAVATYPPAVSTGPVEAARIAARANNAVLVACRCPRDSSMRSRTVQVMAAVRVEVPIFGELTVRVPSRAEFDPVLWLGG